MRSRDSSPSGDLSSVIDLKYLDQSNVFQMPKPETTVLRARSNSISEERVNIAAKVRVFPFVVQFRSLLTGLVLWLSFSNYLTFYMATCGLVKLYCFRLIGQLVIL